MQKDSDTPTDDRLATRSTSGLNPNERRFRDMVDALPEAIYTTDAEGRLVHFNPAAVAFSGRVPELGTDRWCVSLKLYQTDGTPMPHDRCPMALAIKEGRDLRGAEAIAERPDGRRIWFAAYPSPLRDAEGKVVGGINMLIDITERKRAEALVSGQKRVLEMLATGEPLQSVLAVLIRAIEAQSEGVRGSILIRSPEGNRFQMGVAPSLPARYLEVMQHSSVCAPYLGPCGCAVDRGEAMVATEIATDDRWSDEWRELMLGLDLRTCYSWPIMASDGRVLGSFGMYSQEQRDPRSRNVELLETATHLAGIAIESRLTEQALRDADRRKDEFLATLAHELRNPLAPLRTGLELMALAGDQQPEVARARTMMTRQVDQLVHLVEDLLDVARITRGKIALRRERIDLGATVRDAVESTRTFIEAAPHELTVTLPRTPVYLHADPLRLAQVFANLLSNAAKYTDPPGRIAIEVGTEGDQAIVRVRDNGRGIPANQLEAIFDMFGQVSDPDDHARGGGLGIGLTLVRQFVELHEGTVAVASAGPGRGAEFTVRLPIATAPAARAEAPAPAAEPQPRIAVRRLMVVDDNRDAAESLAMVLELLGHEVRTAFGGEQALDIGATFAPGAIFMDLGMPGLDGYEAARRMRAASWGRDVVLVALTGWGQDDDKRRAKEAGFDHHLVKPVDIGLVQELLERLDAVPPTA